MALEQSSAIELLHSRSFLAILHTNTLITMKEHQSRRCKFLSQVRLLIHNAHKEQFGFVLSYAFLLLVERYKHSEERKKIFQVATVNTKKTNEFC